MRLRSGVMTPPGSPDGDTVQAEDSSTVKTDGSAAVVPHRHITLLGHRVDLTVFIVHLNIGLYAACFFIQIGSLPYLSKSLGVDPVTFGYLQTTFAVVQLAGGPIFGRFGDLYGGRAALTLAFGSAAVTYGLMAAAWSIPVLFISRVPSIFMHAMQGGQMVVTDLSESNKRAGALGKLGISYGIGMVLGPFIGGILTKVYGEQFAAFVACLGSLLSIVMCLYFLPSQTKSSDTSKSKESSTAVFNMKKLALLLAQPQAVLLLSIKAVAGIPIGIFQSMFSVVAIETFQLEADKNGYIMSYIGVIAMITQGLGISVLIKRISEMNIIRLSALILLCSYLLLAYVETVVQLCVVIAPLSVGLTLMNVVISSALTHTVPDADTGAMLGMNMAVNSLIRTVSPTVGGYMLAAYGFPSFGYLGFFNNLLITLYLGARAIKR